MSRQYGLEPQQLLQVLQQNNQLPAMFADVRRGLTIAAVVHGATVKDTDGNDIDTTSSSVRPPPPRVSTRPSRMTETTPKTTKPTTSCDDDEQ